MVLLLPTFWQYKIIYITLDQTRMLRSIATKKPDLNSLGLYFERYTKALVYSPTVTRPELWQRINEAANTTRNQHPSCLAIGTNFLTSFLRKLL